MANLYRVVYSTDKGQMPSKAVNVSATTTQNAHDAAQTADTKFMKVVSITQLAVIDIAGS